MMPAAARAELAWPLGKLEVSGMRTSWGWALDGTRAGPADQPLDALVDQQRLGEQQEAEADGRHRRPRRSGGRWAAAMSSQIRLKSPSSEAR